MKNRIEYNYAKIVKNMAKVLIIIFSILTLISLFQSILINFTINTKYLRAALDKNEDISTFFKFLSYNIRIISIIIFIFFAAFLFSSIGLLKRKKWSFYSTIILFIITKFIIILTFIHYIININKHTNINHKTQMKFIISPKILILFRNFTYPIFFLTLFLLCLVIVILVIKAAKDNYFK